MNRLTFSAFFVATALAGSFHNASAQMNNLTVQTASPRVARSRSASGATAKSVANAGVAPQMMPPPNGVNPQRFNPNLPRTIAQPPAYLQRRYSPPAQTSNLALAALNVPQSGPMQQPITVDPATRQTELRTLAAMRQRRGVVTREGNILDPATRQNETHTLEAMRQHRGLGPRQQ